MADKHLSADVLRDTLDYNPDTGLFRHKTVRKGVRIGAVAGGLERGYVRIGIDGTLYYAHRLAWLYMTGKDAPNDVDHINGERSDNRFCNLRAVTRSENMQNRRKVGRSNSSGFLGVSWVAAQKKWSARIRTPGRGKYLSLGFFDAPEDAYAAYVEAKRVLHPFGTL